MAQCPRKIISSPHHLMPECSEHAQRINTLHKVRVVFLFSFFIATFRSIKQYYAYPGIGVTNKREYSYSQAVRIGDIVKCSGQGGWDDNGNIDANDLPGQVVKAFQNVEKNVRDAGLRGWEDVYSVRSYHISLEQSFDLMVAQFRKSMPNHQPIWTCVGVRELGLPGMIVELEVEAKANVI